MQNKITWKAYIYCRKSTDDEKQQNTLDHQIDCCTRTAKNNNLVIHKEVIEKISAKKEFSREWFEDMIKTCKKWVIDYIICDEPKRLSRNNIDSSRIIDLMDKNLIKWVLCTSRSYITQNNRDKFLLQLDLSLSKMDNEDRSNDVKVKMITAFKNGKCMWKAYIWYKNITIKKWHKIVVIDEEKAPFVIKAFELRIAWYSYSKIADFFYDNWIVTKHWTKFKVERVKAILNNKFYMWIMTWNWLEWPWNHEPLISEETFYKASEKNKPYVITNKWRKYNLSWMLRDENWIALSWYTKKWHIYYHTQLRSSNTINISEKSISDNFWCLLSDFKMPFPIQKITLEILKEIYNWINTKVDNDKEKLLLEIDKLKKRKSIIFDKYLDWEVEEEIYKEKTKELENRILEEYKKMPKEIKISDEKLNSIKAYSELLLDLYASQSLLTLEEKINILKSLKSELLVTTKKELQLAESRLVKTLKKLQFHVWYRCQEVSHTTLLILKQYNKLEVFVKRMIDTLPRYETLIEKFKTI